MTGATNPEKLETLLARVRECQLCEAVLPLGPRPIVRAQPSSQILIIGQAPGTRVHETGMPWNARSGDVLREWLDVDKATFYDESYFAIVPMGFCYPGVNPHGGDNPPRPECANTWHAALLAQLPNIKLTLLIGMYAQARYLAKEKKRSLTDTVAAWQDYEPNYLPLPHPSWRNLHWRRQNSWFEAEVVPELRSRVHALLSI